MRLVINSRGSYVGGLNLYKDEEIYQALGRKHPGLRKVETNEADEDKLNKNIEGKEVDADDSNIDKCVKREFDEESRNH